LFDAQGFLQQPADNPYLVIIWFIASQSLSLDQRMFDQFFGPAFAAGQNLEQTISGISLAPV
jgi:hypothetical protein